MLFEILVTFVCLFLLSYAQYDPVYHRLAGRKFIWTTLNYPKCTDIVENTIEAVPDAWYGSHTKVTKIHNEYYEVTAANPNPFDATSQADLSAPEMKVYIQVSKQIKLILTFHVKLFNFDTQNVLSDAMPSRHELYGCQIKSRPR